MSNRIKNSEAGQGGKRGHSNMEHWFKTKEIKDSAKKARRINAKKEIRAIEKV